MRRAAAACLLAMPRLGLLRDTDGDRPGGDSHRDRGGARKAGVEPEIKTFAFVSKRLALRRMAKRHPGFVQGIPSNPLPPAYEVVPRSVQDARTLAAELRRARGVEHVSAARSC